MTEMNMTLSDMKAQISKTKKRNLTVSKAGKEKVKEAQKEAKKKAVKVTSTEKPKTAKTKTEKKVINKEANLETLKKAVTKTFNKGFTVTTGKRTSKYGGMLVVKPENSKSFEIWDEMEINNRICIFTSSTLYETYKAELATIQIKECIDHPKWALNKQFYVPADKVDTALKKIATGCASLKTELK